MVLSSPTLATDQQPKRTRIVVRQSRNGCFTCKARRIKCDEGRPSCQRCSRSNKICEGYPRQSSTNNSSSTLTPPSSPSEQSSDQLSREESSVAPRYALVDGFRTNSEQDRLSKLGCKILAHDPFQDESSFGKCIWEYLLPQLSHAIPTVNAAAAALGAFYELRLMPNSTDRFKSIATKQYDIALLSLQQDISNQPHGSIPLLLACAMLASAEIMQRHQFNALIHLQGAFRILSVSDRSRPRPRALEGTEQVLAPGSDKDDSTATNNDLNLLFQALDVQTAGYILGRPPDLPASMFDDVGTRSRQFGSVSEAEARLIPLLHSCYHFTARASAFKYLSHASITPDVLIEQGRHIACLSQWLEILDHDVLSALPDAALRMSAKTYSHALMLRAQCLCTIVYASTVLSAHEAAYDLHASRFTQIVADVTTALSNSQDTMTGLHQYRPGPGIVQSLFLTAIKYRHSAQRRKAVELLRRAGLEGPWDGKLLAVVASRAIEIEEEHVDLQASEEREVLPEHISERDRLHGCGTDAEAAPDKPMNMVIVMFSRCRDVERMVSGPLSWDDKSNWDIWDEELLF